MIALSIGGAVVVLVGGLVTLWQTWLRWRAHRVAELRPLARSMDAIFGDVIAHGEQDTTVFISGAGQGLETQLIDLRDQLRDKKLETKAEGLRLLWREVFANAPPPFIAIASIGPGNTPHRVTNRTGSAMKKIERQIEAARQGQIAVNDLLARCNEVTRYIVGSS